MLHGSLAASLLPSLLSRKGSGVTRAGQGLKRAGQRWLEPLNNFQIIEYYKNNPKFYGVYPKDRLPNKKPGGYIINLGNSETPGSHWVAIHNEYYFDSFGVDPPIEIINFFKKDFISNTYRIQELYSIMCGYFCIGFLNHMFDGGNFEDFISRFDPNDFTKNDEIIINILKKYES